MDGLTLLEDARAAGLAVRADNGRLVIRGPKRAEDVALRLLAHKAAVLDALASPWPIPAVNPDDLPPDWRDVYEERAGIMECDGGLPKEQAEAAALADTLTRMRACGALPPR